MPIERSVKMIKARIKRIMARIKIIEIEESLKRKRIPLRNSMGLSRMKGFSKLCRMVMVF